MKKITSLLFLLITILYFDAKAQYEKPVIGIHLLNYVSDADLIVLEKMVPELAERGINTIFLEVDYNYEFKSYPNLIQTNNPITFKGAQRFTKTCSELGIEVIPQFQSLGHQSWAENTFKLLTEYPELDLTPGAFPNNDSIYCREWDVTNPKVNEIVFKLIKEIAEGFNAKGIHLGMDEVFLLGHNKSPNTKGKDPAKLFAKTVNEFHEFLTVDNNIQVYIWGDRLIDASKYGYGSWEASTNGTAPAIDMIPKDVIICDWHYNVQKSYPSVDLFIEKGFRVLPCSWKNVDAVKALIQYSYPMKSDKMLGHMFTTWSNTPDDLLDFPALDMGLNVINKQMFHEVYFNLVKNSKGENVLKLSTVDPSLTIKYSLTDPDLNETKIYQDPLPFKNTINIYAQAYKNGEEAGEINLGYFIYHKGIDKKVTVSTKMSEDYATENRERTLNNGIYETSGFSDGEWLGFNGEDLIATFDLGSKMEVSKVSMNFFNEVNSWIHHPNEVIIYGSNDGINFTEIGIWKSRRVGKPVLNSQIDVKGNYRYVKVVAKNKKIPEGFNGEGEPAWIFVDEIIIN